MSSIPIPSSFICLTTRGSEKTDLEEDDWGGEEEEEEEEEAWWGLLPR